MGGGRDQSPSASEALFPVAGHQAVSRAGLVEQQQAPANFPFISTADSGGGRAGTGDAPARSPGQETLAASCRIVRHAEIVVLPGLWARSLSEV